MITSQHTSAILLALSIVAVVRADEMRTNAWRMQVGWVHQWGRGMSVRGPAPSLSASDLSTAPLGGRTLHAGLPVPTYPDNSLLIPRLFDDGFVSPDLWTGDNGLLGTDRYGMTWNWGVNNASQYQYDSGVHPALSFQITGRQAVVGDTTLSGGTSDDTMPTDGVEVKFSRRLCTWTNCDLVIADSSLTWTNSMASLDLALGMAWFPQAKQHTARQASMGVYSVTETYSYLDYFGTSAGGGYPPLDVPYQGTFGTLGPTIPETPESWDYTLTPLGTARDSIAIDSMIRHLRGEVGLTLTKEVTPRLSLSVTPQVVLEFIDMEATRRETLSYTDTQTGTTTALASRTETRHRDTVMPAILLAGGANYLLSENWFVGASFGWEWLARAPSLRVGPDHVRFDLDGGEFSLYIGRRF